MAHAFILTRYRLNNDRRPSQDVRQAIQARDNILISGGTGTGFEPILRRDYVLEIVAV
jgi:hypothetical protein